MDKLLEREHAGSFDFIFVSGDQANALNAIGEPADLAMNNEAEASNRRIVETLTTMHKPTGKLIFIPGNHDAEVLMDAEAMPPINDTSINLHNRVHELIPGLIIAGLGGSLPTQFKEEGSNSYVNVFTPYPFPNEEAYTEAITSLW